MSKNNNPSKYGKSQDFKGTMKKLAVYLRPYYFKIFISAILAFLYALFNVLGPFLVRKDNF